MRRSLMLVLLVVWLAPLLLVSTPAVARSDTRCFPETGFCIAGVLWLRVANFGYALFGNGEVSASPMFEYRARGRISFLGGTPGPVTST